MINLSFEDVPYRTLMTKLRDIAREEVGDPTIYLEKQRRTRSNSAAICTMEKPGSSKSGTKINSKGGAFVAKRKGIEKMNALEKRQENHKSQTLINPDRPTLFRNSTSKGTKRQRMKRKQSLPSSTAQMHLIM